MAKDSRALRVRFCWMFVVVVVVFVTDALN